MDLLPTAMGSFEVPTSHMASKKAKDAVYLRTAQPYLHTIQSIAFSEAHGNIKRLDSGYRDMTGPCRDNGELTSRKLAVGCVQKGH